MSLIDDLREAPAHLPPSSRFVVLNGFAYFGFGLMLLLWPACVQVLFRDPPFAGREAELVRVIGMTIAVIGWFYFFGGRTGGRQVVAATVVDRIVIVPLVLIPIALSGVFPHILWTFAILDPVLGFAAWYLLSRESGNQADASP